MKIISVSSDREYEVLIDASWSDEFRKIATQHERILVLAPQSVDQLFGISDFVRPFVNVHLESIPDGEEQKKIEIVDRLWSFLGKNGFTRSDAIVAIGGGATSDLAGFVAATWLRGINWYAFPTTLAGMVDASVGGKTGINSAAGKNMIGSFFSPVKVISDLNFLDQLSDRDFSAGLAEVIKTGLISDPEIISLLLNCDSIDSARLLAFELIFRSVQVKCSVVSQDFKEGKLREILNYGHTLGHAIEKYSNYKLRHGEAISIGLVFAAELSLQLCALSQSDVTIHRTLLSKFGLPISFPKSAWPDLLLLLRSDKKARGSRLRFIGLEQIGKPVWLEDVPEEILRQTYERISS
jgi:3-dehydroquinate synthase